jgi:hypothetical protein
VIEERSKFVERGVNPRVRVYAAGFLALSLIGLGFVAGYGYGFGKYQQVKPVTATPKPAALAPVVKGMRVSPNGHLLAFTGVYDQSRRASRFVFNLQNGAWSAQESPLGWQDYITQWSADSSRVLFEREKIPRPVADAKAGIYADKVLSSATATPSRTSESVKSQPQFSQAQPLTQGVTPGDEKIMTGFWDARGRLIIKTRREPKALYGVEGKRAVLLDRTSGTYLQNRAVMENGVSVLYVMRDIDSNGTQALFRVVGNKAQRISEPLRDVVWSYVAENARAMIVCYYAANDEDWRWVYYRITPQKALKVQENTVPGDVISVYWSPDSRFVLGSSGQSLWLIDLPSLKSKRLGTRRDWYADDAAWLADSKAVLVAADGKLWKVNLLGGQSRAIWTFPAPYWK